MWLTVPHPGRGGEHPTQLHSSLLVAALLIQGGGGFPGAWESHTCEENTPFPSLPKEPRVHSQPRAVPALLAGYRGT